MPTGYDPQRVHDMAQANLALLVLNVLLGLSIVWWWRAERWMTVSQGESFWRVYRRMLWRRCWRSLVVAAAIGIVFAFGGRDAEDAGKKIGSVMGLYPLLFIVIAATTWRATTRRLGGQSRVAVWASNVVVALIAAGLIGLDLIVVGAVFVAMSNLSKYRNDVPTGPQTLSFPAHTTVCADIAAPLRERASKIVGTLIDCGISSEEALRIAIYEMPNGKSWYSQFLPTLKQEQQRMVIRELQQYAEVGQKSAKNVILAHLYEIAICKELQEEKQLSINEVFDFWHAGLCNQSEEWWRSQLLGLPPVKQEELDKLRKNLMQSESER